MKLINFFAFFTSFILAFTAISTLAIPYTFDKRDSSIATTFKTISQVIGQLQQAQASAGQTGTPDFSKASGLLVQLSQLAESADSYLVGLGKNKVDYTSANSIGQSLASSAQSVSSITSLIQKGKQWFAKNNATQKVIQILQVNISQFHQLFVNLNSHVARANSYVRHEKRIICAMVDAIATLDQGQASAGARNFCNVGSDGGAYDDDKGLDAFNNGATPTGYETCGNSPTMYFQQAYTSKTLGSNVQCPSTQKPSPNSFKVPSNPLLL